MQGFEIRRVQPGEVEEVIALFARDYYTDHPEEAKAHFADHATGSGATFLAFRDDAWAGYVTLRWVSENIRFREANIPLIHHLEVFEPYRRQGLGWRLMDEAEGLIATRATQAGITVGLFESYGPAQRLYARRGYLPDGRGACRGHRPIARGEPVTMDHDLILWLTKDLTKAETKA
jgi:GNAT superfamily N-acetyltransferase